MFVVVVVAVIVVVVVSVRVSVVLVVDVVVDMFVVVDGDDVIVVEFAGVVDVAKAAGAKLIIVNNQETQYDDLADGVLRDSINEVIPLILSA